MQRKENAVKDSNREALQARLNAFYVTALADIRPRLDQAHLDRLSAPLLISVSQAYLDAPLRIMFVGKETNGWWGKLQRYYATKDALDALLQRYRKQMHMPHWPGRFFRMLARTARELADGPPEAIAWTNLLRTDWEQGKGFSRNAKGFSATLAELSATMLRREVELLAPDVIIFACGASYDSVIKSTFPDRTDSIAIVKRALWQFRIGDALCFRTRHPQAIRREASSFLPVDCYYEDIFARVRTAFPDAAAKAP